MKIDVFIVVSVCLTSTKEDIVTDTSVNSMEKYW